MVQENCFSVGHFHFYVSKLKKAPKWRLRRSGGLASLSGSFPGLPGRLKASRNSCYSSVLTPEGPGRPKVGRRRPQGGPRNDMPSTGHFVEFDRYKMAGRSKKLARQIDAKLRINALHELSVLLSAEVVKICSHSLSCKNFAFCILALFD